MATGKSLGFTADWRDWRPCAALPLVERGDDGETGRRAWFLQLPDAQERALARLARRTGFSRAEFLARILAGALERGGGA